MAKKKSEIVETVQQDGIFWTVNRSANTAAGMKELLREVFEAQQAEPERSLKWHEAQAGAILESEGWLSTWCAELVTWGAGSNAKQPSKKKPSRRAKHAKEVLGCAKGVREAWSNEAWRFVFLHSVSLGRAAVRAAIGPFEDDISGAESRTKDLCEENLKRHSEAKSEHDRWRATDVEIIRARPEIAGNESERARAVKDKLKLSVHIDTIRKRLPDICGN